jgi:DNA modification methylase
MPDATFLQGDCRHLLPQLPAASVHCAISSPPYWSLRDYGLEPSVWGGEPGCAHAWGTEGHSTQRLRNGEGSTTAKQAVPVTLHPSTGQHCRLCAAWRGCLGLEPQPDCRGWATGAPCGACYVCHMVEVFRGVRRVLRDDGTLWVNLGDSYAPSGGGGHKDWHKNPGLSHSARRGGVPHRTTPGLKPKDLCGLPWRVALALQADGWLLRSDIIWHKPNPMPESVRDRPTKSHEYLFLLAKKPRYFYDAEAVKEAACCTPRPTTSRMHAGVKRALVHEGAIVTSTLGYNRPALGRNRRSVWTLATAPFKAAHFATFPPRLVEPCLLAGCPVGGTVLDPFAGAGTVALVAAQHGRASIGMELNPAYIALAEARLKEIA